MSARVEDAVAEVREDLPAHDASDAGQAEGRRHGLDMLLVAVLVSSLIAGLGMVLATPPAEVTVDDMVGNEPVETRDPEAVDEAPDDADDEAEDSDYEYTEDVLGVYETRATAGDETVRARNLQTAARALNGIIIDAGEELSLNEVIGEVAPARGYEDVIDVEYAVDAVDQLAGTLHVAALKAGLTISERAAHMEPVEYMPLGMDAMVAWDMEDLVIYNGLGSAVTLQATASGTTVTVSVLGVPDDASLAYDVESQVVNTYTRSASEVYDDPLAQGLLSSDSIQFSVTETYLVTYQGDEEVSRELLYADTYQMASPVVGVDEGAYQAG